MTLIKAELYGEWQGLRRHQVVVVPRRSRRRGTGTSTRGLARVGGRVRRSVIEIDGLSRRPAAPSCGESVPAGRGEVTEKVLEHEPRRKHRIEFADPTMTGR